MQSYSGSNYNSDDGLDKNYKIPKRKADQMDNSSTSTAAGGYSTFYNQQQQQQTPLANSYYNYNNNSNYQYPNTTAYYGDYAQYYSAYNTAMSVPPPPPPAETTNSTNSVDPVTQGIYKALTDIKEKPKNYRANIYSRENYQARGPKQFSNTYNYNNTQQYSAQSYQPKGPKRFSNTDTNTYNNNYQSYSAENYQRKGANRFSDSNTYYNKTQPYYRENYQPKGAKRMSDTNNVRNPFQSTVPDVIDETLPKDLKALFQPLYCKLCSAQLSSNLNAKTHYKSKNHEKKIKKWLVEYSERTGEPLHKRAKMINEKQNEDAEKNPTWFHCEVCDLPLTGRLHAESHYMGRNHQKAMLGHKNPTGGGYYNDEGKWVRTKGGKSSTYNFENGEDNFGTSFRADGSMVKAETAPKSIKSPQQQSKFHCDVCNIDTTCQEQLESHYRGAKHQKKLKQAGLTKYTEQREIVEQCATILPPQVNFTTLTDNVPPPTNGKSELNLSVYRTPSGDYYCPSCNITSNSEGQFVQHMKSKNHNKKAQKKN